MYHPELLHETVLRRADLWENGRSLDTATLAPGGPVVFGDTGGPQQIAMAVGAGARHRITCDGTLFGIELDSTWGGSIGSNNRVGIRINDGVNPVKDIIIGAMRGAGSNLFSVMPFASEVIGPKRIDLYVPAQHAPSGTAVPWAGYPVRLYSNKEITIVPPAGQTFRLAVLGASQEAGGNAIEQSMLGYIGLMKRGLTCQFGVLWKGAYGATTTYAIGELVSSGALIYQKVSAAVAGTAPVDGADWIIYGFNGTVELYRTWGSKQLATDWSTPANRSLYAAELAAKGFTHILFADGTNDWGVIPATGPTNYETYESARYDSVYAVMPASVKIYRITSFWRSATNTEAVNYQGDLLQAYRDKQIAQVNARAGRAIPPVLIDGKAMHGPEGVNDGTHQTTEQHLINMRKTLIAMA